MEATNMSCRPADHHEIIERQCLTACIDDRKPHTIYFQRTRYLNFGLVLIAITSLSYILYLQTSTTSTGCDANAVLQHAEKIPSLPSTDSDTDICDCGLTHSEALSRSCVFDSLAAAWLPPHCRDTALTIQFERAGPGPNGSWPYYRDPDGQQPISVDEIGVLGFENKTFWALREWHVGHCLFYWQKLIRVEEEGTVLERSFRGLEHARHCTRLIMDRRPGRPVLLEVDVKLRSGG